MAQTRQTVFKAVCAVIPILVLAQIFWAYHQADPDHPLLPFHHDSPVKPAPNVSCYGGNDCFPTYRNYSIYDWENNTQFCRDHGPGLMDPPPRLATLTAQFGDAELIYQRALGTHVLQSMVQRTQLHVLRAKIIDDLWNKPAFILELLLVEMSKPEADRLQWLFWVDRDTILLDACRTPLSFLPVAARDANRTTGGGLYSNPWYPVDNIHLLATKDWNGLNNGIFLLRVNRWAVDLFTGILALRYYRPGVDLPFTEQSAMGMLLEEPQFRDNVVWTPQWWFNAYPRPQEDFSPVADDSLKQKAEELHARRGDYLVHFAGRGDREEAMTPWLDKAESAMTSWALEAPERRLDVEIERFWESWREEKGIVVPT